MLFCILNCSHCVIGPEEFKLEDLDEAFKLCSHLIYGFAGINVTTGEIACLNPSVDFDEGLGMYNKILEFRQRFPHVKILLSIGGAADPEVDTHKYLTVVRIRKVLNQMD